MEHIVDSKHFKHSDISSIPKHILYVIIDDDFDYYYENDEDLNKDDFLILKLKFEQKEYTMIHGFPGDNCAGVIFNENELYPIGEGESSTQSEPENWYYKITNDLEDFDMLVIDR